MISLPEYLTQVLADPLAAARSHATVGQTVIGTASSEVPVELIMAAGAFPVALPYEPRPTPQADVYLEATFSPAARSLTEQLAERKVRLHGCGGFFRAAMTAYNAPTIIYASYSAGNWRADRGLCCSTSPRFRVIPAWHTLARRPCGFHKH